MTREYKEMRHDVISFKQQYVILSFLYLRRNMFTLLELNKIMFG